MADTDNATEKMNMRRWASLAIGLVAVFLGFYLIQRPLNSDKSALRIDNGPTFIVDIADEPEERQQGLSGRGSMGEREGMLFVFADGDIRPFVMRGMNFPLDIVWIGEDKRINGIEYNAQPEDYPDKSHISINPAMYVLEVNAGVAESIGFEIGDQVEFTE